VSGALLIQGELVIVPGVDIIGPHERAWSYLDPGDCRPRSNRPHMVVLHKTLADDPEKILAGAGKPGGAERTAEYWEQDPKHSGAHLVTGDDGVVACLADLVNVEAYHGNQANLYSIGFETRELVGGGVYQAALNSTVAVVLAIVEHLGIQLQVPTPYRGKPLRRMADGGSDLIGIFGHRDITDQRGVWDPGDILFQMLRASGAEMFDFDLGQDKVVWAKRQEDLNAKGYKLGVDGIPGPATTAALKAEGYRGGVYALGKL
jgi:hypothetical protein